MMLRTGGKENESITPVSDCQSEKSYCILNHALLFFY